MFGAVHITSRITLFKCRVLGTAEQTTNVVTAFYITCRITLLNCGSVAKSDQTTNIPSLAADTTVCMTPSDDDFLCITNQTTDVVVANDIAVCRTIGNAGLQSGVYVFVGQHTFAAVSFA